MTNSLKDLEKLINSELSSKVKLSKIENNELLIETEENELLDVVQFLKIILHLKNHLYLFLDKFDYV